MVERGPRDQEQVRETRQRTEVSTGPPEEKAFRWAIDEAWESAGKEEETDDDAPMATPKSKPLPKQRPRTYGNLGRAATSGSEKAKEIVGDRGEPRASNPGSATNRPGGEGGDKDRRGTSSATSHPEERTEKENDQRKSSSATRSSGDRREEGDQEWSRSSGEMDPQERHCRVMNEVVQYLPRPYRFCLPRFEEDLIFTNLFNESMEDVINRVVPNWPTEYRHLLPDGLIPRVMMEPASGEEDGYMSHEAPDGLHIEVRIHRKPRRKFFDSSEGHRDQDPWTRGSLTLMFFQTGDKTMVIQQRRGNRMKLTKLAWRGYTCFYSSPRTT